jgi:anti-sigma regulatory factor (Ser/Thr protein kinase)
MELRVGEGVSGFRTLAVSVDEFCTTHGVPDDARRDVQVALDEIVNNAVRHAAPRHPAIDVRLSIAGADIEIGIEDDGEPFDPRDAPAPDLALPLADRPVGGLGLFLVRKLMDDVEYRRSGGKNCVTLRRRLSGPRPPGAPAPAR